SDIARSNGQRMKPSTIHWLAAWLALSGAGAAVAEPLSKPVDNRLHVRRGVVYAGTAFLSATGGQAPYSFSVDASALAPGLSVLPDGSIWGATCGSDGIYLLGAVMVVDAMGARASDASPMLAVDAASAGACTLRLDAQGSKPVLGEPYRAMLSAQGGVAPYS